MNNGYSSATGQQEILSSARQTGGRGPGLDIEATLKSLGVGFIKRVRSYAVASMPVGSKRRFARAARALK